ncbi:SDR family oxidoreductase [Patescibacteria group bacterium]|nr:SDR family oxidoreductase [Patescibacteria group bacterium]
MIKFKNLVKRIALNPVRARIAYDLFISTFSIISIYLIFFIFNLNIFISWIFLIFYPLLFVSLNYFHGIYGKLKTSSTVLKAISLTSSVALCFVIYLLIFNTVSPLMILSSIFVLLLAILPRVFFNYPTYNREGKYIATIMNDKLPILVVGGGGYIGSHLVEQLLKKNYKVRVFDKFIYGKEVLADLKNNHNLEIIEGDISDLYALTLALRDTRAVIHLAGLVGDPASSIDSKLTQHFNIVSTRMLIESVKALRIPRFIFASSCSVYGASEKEVNEISDLNPVSLYAKTKIDSENEILQTQSDEFHPTILRFATVFGHSRRPRFDLVTNLFTAQAYNNGQITVLGSNQWRPLIHVSDIANAIVKVIEAPTEKVSRQILNVGDDDLNITIGALAELVAKEVGLDKKGKKIKISINNDIDDPRNYRVSFDKI